MRFGCKLGVLEILQRVVRDVLVVLVPAPKATEEGASLDQAFELGFDDVQDGVVTVFEVDVLLLALSLNFKDHFAEVAVLVRQAPLILKSFFHI